MNLLDGQGDGQELELEVAKEGLRREVTSPQEWPHVVLEQTASPLPLPV